MSARRAAALGDGHGGLREHLITTAAKMIAEQGTAGLTVRALAGAAGVADGVLYNHFSDRDELLALALRSHVDTAHRGMGVLPTAGTATVKANLREYLRAGLTLHRAIMPAMAGLVAQQRALTKFFELPSTHPVWRDLLLDYLRAERDLKRLSASARVEAAAAILVGICHDQALSALLSPRTPPALPDIDAVVDTLLEGIDASQTSARNAP